MQNQNLPIVIYLIQMLEEMFAFSLLTMESVRKKERMQQPWIVHLSVLFSVEELYFCDSTCGGGAL